MCLTISSSGGVWILLYSHVTTARPAGSHLRAHITSTTLLCHLLPTQVLIEATNPDGKGHPLLQTGSPASLQLLYPPGTHSPCKHLLSPAADADALASMEQPVSDFRAVHIHAVGYYLLRWVCLVWQLGEPTWSSCTRAWGVALCRKP
jgi:hypothetical protein